MKSKRVPGHTPFLDASLRLYSVQANDRVGKRKLNDARSLIRNVIVENLRTINFAISKAVSKDGISIPPPIFSGIFNIEADHKISDQLIASVKA
uniref:Uncharacterized protein n=1 Tax=Chenopodium quinoa TaxID=63459 RepID=A0A803LA07_CHEQI